METTLTTAPLAPLLERLYEEADAESPATSPAVTELSVEERTRLMQSKTDYLALFVRLKDFSLPVSRETSRLLYMLARSSGALGGEPPQTGRLRRRRQHR